MTRGKAGDGGGSDRPDPAEAFRRFENFMRRLLQVPKKAIDRRLAEERAAREKRRRKGRAIR